MHQYAGLRGMDGDSTMDDHVLLNLETLAPMPVRDLGYNCDAAMHIHHSSGYNWALYSGLFMISKVVFYYLLRRFVIYISGH